MGNSTIVLITGANSGVGFASAKVITSASGKYHVIVTARTIEKAQAAVDEIKATGAIQGTLSALQLDVTDIPSVERAAAAVEKEFGRLDVLVNNAAMGLVEDANKNMSKYFVDILTTNVVGPFNVLRAFRPLLNNSPDPRSIIVSSGSGSHRIFRLYSGRYKEMGEWVIPYAVSKAALNMLSEVESDIHEGQDSVKNFLFCPGQVVSNLRGRSEEARSGGGAAGDPKVSGQTLLSIIEGERDADIGKGTIHKDGVYDW